MLEALLAPVLPAAEVARIEDALTCVADAIRITRHTTVIAGTLEAYVRGGGCSRQRRAGTLTKLLESYWSRHASLCRGRDRDHDRLQRSADVTSSHHGGDDRERDAMPTAYSLTCPSIQWGAQVNDSGVPTCALLRLDE